MPTGEKGKSYKENMEYHRGTSWKAKLRVSIDKAIWSSINYDEFLQKMQLAGYEIRQGKNLSFRAPEQINFTYMKSLGSYYTEENVRLRLEKNRYKTKAPKHLSREARLYINISTYITTGNREGFEHWAKLNNLKEAAKTFNYLSENNLLNYEDFQQHISDVENSIKATEHRIEEIGNEINTQKVIQKHCDSYRLCRKVIEAGKSAPNQKDYRSRHQAEYQLHDSLKKELQDLGVTKIPSSEKIQKKIKNLETEHVATIKEKQELQKKQKTLNIRDYEKKSVTVTYRHACFPTKVNLIFLPSCPRSVLYWIPYSRINRSRLTFNFRDNAFGCISTCNTFTSSVAVPAHSGVISVTSSLIFSSKGSSGSFQSSVSVLVNSQTHLSRLKFSHSF